MPGLALGENRALIQELRDISELTAAYAAWAHDPSATDARAFPFEEQILLSVRLAALGQAIRELTYTRMDEDQASAAETPR